MSSVVSLSGLKRSFFDGQAQRTVLRGIDLEVRSGEMVALIGPSGCGKTTLLTILGALDRAFEGKVELFGERLRQMNDDALTRLRGGHIGFVFQAFHLLEHLTVVQNVEVPLWLLPERLDSGEERRRASEALEKVGLGGREDERVTTLSGGERQRVAIARAIVNRPQLLLADEPTGNLDPVTGGTIYDLFDSIRKGDGDADPCAIVIATHDVRLAERADRVVRLENGQLASEEAPA